MAARYPDLQGKIALLTGGANGIGAATVELLAAQGCVVEFCDLDRNAGKTLAKKISRTSFTRVDIAQETEVVRWVTRAAGEHGRIDILINNAAVDPRIPLQELGSQELEKVLAINLKPLFYTTRAAAPYVGPGGAIVNLGSITFHSAPAMMSAYVATKGAIIGATRALARELGSSGIRVNTVSPGWVMTERQLREYVDGKTKKLIRQSQCVPDLLQPAEIAEVVAFLASRSSRAITGQEILADRGWMHH